MQLDDPRTKDETEGCTCERDAEFIEPHTCPFREDVNDDYEYTCTCCPYCTQECAEDI